MAQLVLSWREGGRAAPPQPEGPGPRRAWFERAWRAFPLVALLAPPRPPAPRLRSETPPWQPAQMLYIQMVEGMQKMQGFGPPSPWPTWQQMAVCLFRTDVLLVNVGFSQCASFCGDACIYAVAAAAPQAPFI